MAIYTTATQKGQKEDVEDIIYDISPTDTPFTSSIGATSANAIVHSWQEDSLAAAGVNSAPEGVDAPDLTTAATTEKSNRCQIFVKDVSVSGTAEAIGKYGRSSEMSYQIAKRGKEIKRDIEHAFVGLHQDSAAQAGTGANQGRKMAAYLNQLDTSTLNTASARAWTETLTLDVLQACYENGGNPNQIHVIPSHALKFAGLAKTGSAGANTTRDFGTGTTVVNAVDVYVSPYGTTAIIPNRFLFKATNDNDMLMVDTEYWSRAVLRPMQTVNLATTGDAEKKQLITELTLVCENSKASGMLENLND